MSMKIARLRLNLEKHANVVSRYHSYNYAQVIDKRIRIHECKGCILSTMNASIFNFKLFTVHPLVKEIKLMSVRRIFHMLYNLHILFCIFYFYSYKLHYIFIGGRFSNYFLRFHHSIGIAQFDYSTPLTSMPDNRNSTVSTSGGYFDIAKII